MGSITRIVISHDNESYFLGYEDGSIVILNAVDLSFKEIYSYIYFVKMKTPILDIYADKKIIILTHQDGTINILKKSKER